MDVGLTPNLPFDSGLLDRLMEQQGLDVLVVSAKHNIQYLLGGYRFFFFEHFDAIGVSRYLPLLIYPRGRPEHASYVGNAMEVFEAENGMFWTPRVDTAVWGSVQAMTVAIGHLRDLGPVSRIGIEFAFMPADAADLLRREMPDCEVTEAHFPLERLRAIKTVPELRLIEQASERVVAAMQAVFATTQPGMDKRQIVAALKREETARDLEFEYCLISAGTSLNRAPSDQVLQQGDIYTLDSGGRYEGYIGDLCRMGSIGEPDPELVDLLAEVEAIQQAARGPVRAGARGGDIFAAADPVVHASSNRESLHFVAHGVGIIGHEAPRLSGRGPVTYEGYDMDRPLAAGMVLSIETTMLHPRRGMIKLEDTLAVTETGWTAFGDGSRGWNCSTAH